MNFAARVEIEQRQIVLLLEFQTRWEADVPQRMIGYTWRLYERYQLPVYPVVMVFRNRGGRGRSRKNGKVETPLHALRSSGVR